jgi:hypothetical protein
MTAQTKTKTELSLYAGGGLSTLQYSGVASSGFGIGGHVGVGYDFYLFPRWSFGAGVEMSLLNAKAELATLNDAYAANDGVDNFVFLSTVTNYSEKIQIYFLQVPVMVHYHYPIGKSTSFVVGLGGKVGIPLINSTDGGSEQAKTKGYYPAYDLMLEMPKFQGFGTFDDLKAVNSPSFKTAFMVSAEAGVQWGLSNDWGIYVGGYLDYGVNSIINEPQDKQFIPYDAEHPADLYHNSLLLSQYTRGYQPKPSSDMINVAENTMNGYTEPIAGSVTPLYLGLKVKLIIGGSKKSCDCPRYEMEMRGTKRK